jgi:phage repressor protein C with HTH and peptisase S24 domain
MHESMQRLYRAAMEMKKVTGKSNVARLLETSPQVLTNWEARGVSNEGAIKAQQLIGCSAVWVTDGTGNMSTTVELIRYPVSTSSSRKVWVVGKGKGGIPERIWTDADYPVGASDEYAEIATADEHAFLVPIVGDSMAPRYQPGEFALVEPATEPELEDDVLVRLATGETMIKRLLSRRGGIRLGSWNDPAVIQLQQDDVVWMYYIAHPVPARKIKTRM